MSPIARRALRMLIIACAMWGLSFPTMKALALVQAQALAGADSWFFAGATMVVRFALAALVVCLCLLRGSVRCTRAELMQGLGLGLFGGAGMLFQVDGLAYTEASTSAFLTQGSVIFIPLVKALLQRTLPSRRALVCCLLAMIGVAVLAQFDWQALRLGRGEAETLIAAMFFTGQILWLERPCHAGNDARRVSLVMFATVALLSAPLIARAPMLALRSLQPVGAWWCLAILVGPCTLGAYLWMNRWQPHVSATTAGLIYCLEPVFASVLALVLPAGLSALLAVHYANERASWPMLIGGGLILLANLFMQWPARQSDDSSLMNEHAS